MNNVMVIGDIYRGNRTEIPSSSNMDHNMLVGNVSVENMSVAHWIFRILKVSIENIDRTLSLDAS